MLHHYLQKGILPDYILKLHYSEKLFYKASMELFFEEEAEKLKATGLTSF